MHKLVTFEPFYEILKTLKCDHHKRNISQYFLGLLTFESLKGILKSAVYGLSVL